MGAAAGKGTCACGQLASLSGTEIGDADCPATCVRSDSEGLAILDPAAAQAECVALQDVPPLQGVLLALPDESPTVESADSPPHSAEASHPVLANAISEQASLPGAEAVQAAPEEAAPLLPKAAIVKTEKAIDIKQPKAKRKAAAKVAPQVEPPPPPPPLKAEVAKKKEPKEKKLKAIPKKKSFLQRGIEERAAREEKKVEMRELVDKIVAGDFKKEGQGQAGGNMRIKMPTPTDRTNNRILVLGHFRGLYKRILDRQAMSNKNCPSGQLPSNDAVEGAATTQYTTTEISALQIVGGHQPYPRPPNVNLPVDFRKPVGIISLATLGDFDCNSHRKLCSVYGDIFDVSDRPDKYGTDGPYSWMTGVDITWGFVSGRDVPETVNKCFDLWKVAPEPFRDAKLKLIFAWVAFYEFEYGDSVGKLDLYDNEAALKGPPMEESEDCCIM